MSENVIKSEDVAPKKQTKTAKSATETEKINEDSKEEVEKKPKKSSSNKKVAQASPGKKFVYFSSGSGYVTRSGFRFSAEKRIYELDIEEADHLLSLDNFRLPDQLELEDYYKENN
jgi:hypothetical protein